jgi:hypothetical protein
MPEVDPAFLRRHFGAAPYSMEDVMGMKKSFLIGLTLAILSGLMFAVASPADAETLWYNGDFNGVTGLTNGTYSDGTSLLTGMVYDDFVVQPGTAWKVETVWVNELVQGTFSTATWSIRTLVSQGNSGRLVATGTSDITMTPTGRKGFGLNEYTIEVTGLNVKLTAGTYWLSVAPIGDESSFGYITTTSGANAIGTISNGNAFDNDPGFGFPAGYYNATTNIDPRLVNFSMGIGGVDPPEVPLPGAVWLLGSGLGLLAWGRKRWQS